MRLEHDGFYKHDYLTRLALVLGQITETKSARKVIAHNYDSKLANIIENYLTNYQLPEGIATNLVVNGIEYMVPMVTEEPSVIAACSNGSKLLSSDDGILATVISNLVDGQIILKSSQFELVEKYIAKHATEIIKVANQSHPSIKKYSQGVVSVNTRRLDSQYLSLDVVVDAGEAMGANIVNSMLEAIKGYLETNLSQTETLMAILTNNAQHALVKVRGQVPVSKLATSEVDGRVVAQRISEASYIAEIDPIRATTHNKGIMNGVDAVAIALGMIGEH
ncbi:hydroxymethylglutaryl-CoA reductase [Lentilactobacillus kosonis]|uniref:Hydroxymethylglutaryl-CoA reductase n=1 Tax=Lentilactobacillus kosonis TaxID=2810561 RepID=A0A401FPD0_9LACO|nr:3-hydroxy-3-methylglutaryl-CoA reductase [Lentilactobacillus kosonis]GAY74222.1 hydroxymethylglutaryl-CoA reductase [Lentilactobacillus kosonis]